MKRATRNFHFTREDGRVRDVVEGEDVVAAGVSKEQIKHFESTGWVEDVPTVKAHFEEKSKPKSKTTEEG